MNFENDPSKSEKTKEYSKETVQEIHQLAIKVRDLIGWDLGSFCSDSKEIEMVNDAKDAMKEIENIFKIPQQRYWYEEKKDEDEPNIENQQLSHKSFTKVQESLDKIENILGWNLASHCKDEVDLKVVRDAEKAFEELNKILK